MDVPAQLFSAHFNSVSHKKKEKFATYETALQDAAKDKGGVVVQEKELDFETVELATLETQPTRIKTFNISVSRRVKLCEARVTSSIGAYAHLREFKGNRGHYDDRMELIFEDNAARTRFFIVRPLHAIVAVQADLDLLAPTAPYQKPEPRPKEAEAPVIDGPRPPQLAEINWVNDLPFNDLPTFLKVLVEEGSIGERIRAVKAEMLPRELNWKTYGDHWQALLWLEEIQAESFIFGPLHSVSVPGLAEKRPSVIIGDKIKVRNHRPRDGQRNDQRNEHWFRGYVHVVEQNQVGLKFDPSFHSFRGQKYDVRFELNRLTLRRMHQAVAHHKFREERVLFPNEDIVKKLRMRKPVDRQMDRYSPFDRQIATNPPQWLAVTAIAELSPGAVPFVVFGPPGTGKTVVLVEAIRQVLTNQPDAKILACAPSNSAADIIAERLGRFLSKRELFRMNAPTRNKDTIPTKLLDFSRVNPNGTFFVPQKEELMKFRVVVSTCVSASVTYGIGVQNGHFTHIFVDEAGQASEPEVMVPVKMNAGPNTRIILAGDPKQLGPITRSPVAQRLGLATSWLDRLMAMPLYDPADFSGVTVVKLLKNWRSHETILRFPNEEFYKNELEAHADPTVINSCLRWWQLPNPNFPIIFHSIKGKDQRQATSPSFFNAHEASVVKEYITDLKADSGLRITDHMIGVISPYNAQCQKIRTAIKVQNPAVKVGSVEEFQGQERRVIIISTVRSSIEYVEFDLRHTLGFVANERRFNVAMTRAQALLIVIGDPDVLGLDPLWRCFLNYIHNSGGWKGRRIGWDPKQPVDRSPPRTGPRSKGKTLESATTGGYDEAVRRQAETEMEELIARTKGIIINSRPLDEEQEEDEDVRGMEAAAEHPWREDE
ncbi:hypothetical protein M407DRAFT_229531 [Tulasnella calospora MUT 4182]|uniref:RNA helicase n=1 Tax=Tulasnella calospora MUT 4182 TaxID=1051891 RepID=A0A0C3QLN6_9AGAM|nr:hypothetical protein M407DRAFT_229531 [Tulasnella calospora MUT 4182]